ncbi:MAG: 3-phosphoshikimate 1-carboxyvinyltransferase [Flavobacteriaceae bacterium]
MNLTLNNIGKLAFDASINITGSKSESNRLLILQQIFDDLRLENVSNSHDTIVLTKALSGKEKTIDIGHAGTAMRFLTAYFSIKKGCNLVLTGSERMQNRPIKILVDALLSLGADITYLDKEGYPPIQIKGVELIQNKVRIQGNVSSQYISALLLIAPSLKDGLHIELKGEITSIPYIEMTISFLNKIGIETTWDKNTITVLPKKVIKPTAITIESDWSSASYYYSLVALSENGKIKLSSFQKNSRQGDSALAEIYTHFGVKTTFNKDAIYLEKIANFKQKQQVKFDFIKTPDIAQTVAVTCFGLSVSCEIIGLHTLKIKETDRLEALKIELKKLGAKVKITEDSFHLLSETENKTQNAKIKNQVFQIETYDDHRMAMAFAPLSLLMSLEIKDALVVEKSYPTFWKDLASVFN